MATHIGNDISNDEVYARNLQKEEYEKIRKERRDRLRNQILGFPEGENRQRQSNNEDDIIVIDDDDGDNDLHSSRTRNHRRSSSRDRNWRPIRSNRSTLNQETPRETNSDNTDMDEIIARQLQEQFDRENEQNPDLLSSFNVFANLFNQQRRQEDSNSNNSSQNNNNNNNSNNNSNRQRNNRNNSVPFSFEDDLLNSIARSTNRNNRTQRVPRTNRANDNNHQSNSNRTASNSSSRNNHNRNTNNNNNDNDQTRSNTNNPVSELVTALSLFQNQRFLQDFFADDDDNLNNNNNNNVNVPRIRFTNGPNQRRPQFLLPRIGNRGGSNSFSNLFQLPTNRDFNSDDYESLLRLDELHGVKKNLKKEEIDSLPTFEFKGNSETPDENKCSICFEEYAKREMLMALACTHKFHKKCIKTWLQQSRQCPLCKKDAISGQ